MIFRPIINSPIIHKNNYVLHESYIEQYAYDNDFQDVYASLRHRNQIEELDYHVHNSLLYHMGKLFIPQGERNSIIREAHTSLIARHFGVDKTVVNLQRYCFWPHIFNSVSRFIRGCFLCAISKPSNRKLGLYTPLPVPSHPWESISMDIVAGLPLSRKGHDYLYVVVDRFNKICIRKPCKNKITVEQTNHLLFQKFWVHFGLPNSIVSDRDSRFVGNFSSNLWDMMDTKLKKSTTFHTQTNIKTKVINRTFIHPKLWNE